jgi:outer membrane lipoprotein-sorting protein
MWGKEKFLEDKITAQEPKTARSIMAFSLLFIALFFFKTVGVSKSAANSRKECVKKVEEYFNGIKTFEANFVQIDKQGHGSVGHFFLKRPHLMKMDYRVPSTQVIIVKNNKITHYDRELKEKTETSAYSSPLSFLLEPQISLERHLEILSVHDGKDEFSLKLCKKDGETDGAILLVFSKNPLVLKKWILLEDKKNTAAGNTEVFLQNHKYGHYISDKEFEKFEAAP